MPQVPECQIQQFGAAIPNVPVGPDRVITTTPYLFKKTFDNSGKAKTIDAYLFELAGAFHISASISYKGNMVYLMNTEKVNDTAFVITLNSGRRVTRADEYKTFTNFTSRYRYEFTYNSQDRVNRTHITSLNDNTRDSYDTTIYDANGNVTINATSKFEYDLTKTVKSQFYHDIDYRFATFYKGVRLLGYLGYFPELTSPPNLRIIARAIPTSGGAYYANYNLFSHKVDASGKLTSYGFSSGGETTVNTFSYTCDAAKP